MYFSKTLFLLLHASEKNLSDYEFISRFIFSFKALNYTKYINFTYLFTLSVIPPELFTLKFYFILYARKEHSSGI